MKYRELNSQLVFGLSCFADSEMHILYLLLTAHRRCALFRVKGSHINFYTPCVAGSPDLLTVCKVQYMYCSLGWLRTVPLIRFGLAAPDCHR